MLQGKSFLLIISLSRISSAATKRINKKEIMTDNTKEWLANKKEDESEVFDEISNLNRNKKLCELLKSYGLEILKVTWEDTARDKNSSLGPNISDMTLFALDNESIVKGKYSTGKSMCVIRPPNYADRSSDSDVKSFHVTVGNEISDKTRRIPFSEYLKNIALYTKNDKLSSMYLDRDEKILTSAQFCFLPMISDECEFTLQLRNYQSTSENSAVLIIIASSQGTSAQVVDGSTQKLFFNANDKACNWIAKRLKLDRIEKGKKDLEAKIDDEEKDRNVLFVFQIPLKVARHVYRGIAANYEPAYAYATSLQSDIVPESASIPQTFLSSLSGNRGARKSKRVREVIGVDYAVLHVGKPHSNFEGTKGRKLERDDRYPIRCTIQFYQATDTSNIPESLIQEMSEKVNDIYKKGAASGSLVLNEDTGRATEPKLGKPVAFVDESERQKKPLSSLI